MKKTCNVQEPYFTFIKEGRKTVEGRLHKGKFAEMEVGDHVLANDELEVKVIGKKVYTSFREMIEQEGIERVIPNANTIEEAEAVYYKFYTKEQEKEFGVLALELELI